MGGAFSSNTIKDGVDVIANVLVESTQTCQTTNNQEIDVNITATNGGTVRVEKLTIGQLVSTNIACTQTNDVQSSIDNSLDQVISQVASATAQAFSIPGNSAFARNNTKLWTQIATTIKESFNQTCNQHLVQKETVNFTANDGTIITGPLDFNQNVDSMITCIQNNSSVTDIKNQIQQNLSQSATSKIESILGPILAVLIVFGIIIAVVIFLPGTKTTTSSGSETTTGKTTGSDGTTTTTTQKKGGVLKRMVIAEAMGPIAILIGVFFIILVGFIFYLILAFWRKWWPFRPKPT